LVVAWTVVAVFDVVDLVAVSLVAVDLPA